MAARKYIPSVRALLLFLALFFPLSFFILNRERSEIAEDVTLPGLESSEIKIIDNFDSYGGRNQVGGPWVIGPPPGGELQAGLGKYDALNGLRSFSARLTYKVPEGKAGFFEADLNNLDISQAQEIRFWMMRAAGKEDIFFVLLRDSENNNSRLPVKGNISKENAQGWQEVRLPLKEFYNVDTGSLKVFRLLIQPGKDRAVSGVVFFDRLIFTGRKGLSFLSLSDNLIGFPRGGPLEESVRTQLAGQPDEVMLRKIARLTWNHFVNLVDKKTHLPVDNIQVGQFPAIGDYTSPTNIGLYFLACISAQEMGFITREGSVKRIQGTFKTLKKLKRWNGFFYNFYNTTNLQVTRRYVSTVDSGWLAAALIVVRKAYPQELANQADRFLKDMDFSRFYDKSLGQLRLGYDEDEQSMSPFHYGLLVSESRLTSFTAIAKGNVPEEHWFKLYRTPPAEWDWQTQKPVGEEKEIGGVWVFRGMYLYHGVYIVPSWGGSLFEFLMPTLLVKEKALSPRGLGKNDDIAAKIHIQYALKEKKYPVWGLSPCSYPGGYGEFGIQTIGVKGYRDFGIVTPHASFLALEFRPQEVLANIRQFLTLYPILGEYGFYDSVKMRGKDPVTTKYLALDQGMILVSITNYLKRGVIRDYFHEDPGVARSEHLLQEEKFF